MAPRDYPFAAGRRDRDRRAHAPRVARRAVVVAPPGAARAAVELARPVHLGDRPQSPVSRLAGVIPPAAVPPLERPLVLRRLGGYRRSPGLARAAPGAAVGRAAPPAAGGSWPP